MEQQKRYISVLDIGTSKVLALIGEVQDDNEIHIVGLGQSVSRGLRAGLVTNIDATVQAIRQAVNEAELMILTVLSKLQRQSIFRPIIKSCMPLFRTTSLIHNWV